MEQGQAMRLEDLIEEGHLGRVGESGVDLVGLNINTPPYSNASNKKSINNFKKKERYFKSGLSFSEMRDMIEWMRSRIRV